MFLAFLVAMGVCTHHGYSNGQVDRLLAPLDGDDNFCGVDAKVKDYPFLFITNIGVASPAENFRRSVCVKKCPKVDDELDYFKTAKVGDDGRKAKYTTSLVMGYCFPSHFETMPADFKLGWAKTKEAFLSNPTGAYFNDLYLSSRAIYWSCGMSVIYSFIFIYLMSAFAEPIAWICVALAQLGLIGASIGAWFWRAGLAQTLTENKDTYTESMTKDNLKSQKMALLGVIAFGILAAFFLLCICCGFRSLKLAIDVIDASADFLASTKRIILVPVLYFFVTIILFGSWVVCFLNVASLNTIKADTGIIPQMKDLIWEDKKIKYMAWFMFFGLLWIMAFIKYTCNFVCMVAASTYYFNSSAGHEGDAEVGLGFKFAHINHCGSIAFGSFILAVVQFIRFVFLYVAKQAAKAGGDNQAVKIIIAIGDCVLRCVEKVCDYLNTAAFAYMAISGDSFCSSAWNGFLLNVKYMLKFTFANLIAKIFTFLGKVGIVVGNLFSCYFIMKYITKDLEEISSIIGPLAIVGFVSFLTASIFLGLFDTAVMALMTCLAVDIDVHGDPQFGPPTFHESVSKVRSSMSADDAKVGNEMD